MAGIVGSNNQVLKSNSEFYTREEDWTVRVVYLVNGKLAGDFLQFIQGYLSSTERLGELLLAHRGVGSARFISAC